jgi:hypothetical protein
MSWEVAASIAEVVGAIAVVVSLVYLAVQIRSNTRAAKANAYELAIQSEMETAVVFTEHVEIWDKIITGQPLSEGAEQRAGILLYNLLMLDSERRYQQYARGYLDAQPWEARHRTLPAIVSLPVFRLWRRSLGAQSHSADFLKLVDECAARLDAGSAESKH